MGREHGVVLYAAEIKVIILQGWGLSQLVSNYAYPLRDVHSDQHVLKVTWDVFMVNHASQRRYIIWQERWDLLHISHIVAVLASLLSSTARTKSSQGGCLQSPSRQRLYSYIHKSLSPELHENLLHRLL